jgi:hypothetical protein
MYFLFKCEYGTCKPVEITRRGLKIMEEMNKFRVEYIYGIVTMQLIV